MEKEIDMDLQFYEFAKRHLETPKSSESPQTVGCVKKDPICGNCFSPLSNHYHEEEIYCFENTVLDVFTTEPPKEYIMEKMAALYPDIYQLLVDKWKKLNGHT